VRSVVRIVRAKSPELRANLVVTIVVAYFGTRGFGWLAGLVCGGGGVAAIAWSLVRGYGDTDRSRAHSSRGAGEHGGMFGTLVHRSSVVLCACAELSYLSACAGPSDATVVRRTDSAGVEIVLSSATDRTLDWRFHRLFALGGSDDGPESFYRLSAGLIGADRRGNLFVLDPPNARIVVFDPDGQFVRSMGGSGGGPGEFRAPGSISVAGDGSVAVFDYGKGSLVRFDTNGEVLDEQPFPLFPTPWQQRHFSQSHDTTLVSTSTAPWEPGNLIQRLRRIVDADTSTLAELLLPPVEPLTFRECPGVSLPQLPIFAPELAWTAQHGIVAFGSSLEYSVSIAEAGTLSRIVRRQIDPAPASRDLAMSQVGEGFTLTVRESSCHADPDDVVDDRGYGKTIPLIGAMLLGPSGELWIRRFTLESGPTAPLDVFDTRGEYVGTLGQAPLSPVILLPGGRAGAVDTDEVGVQRLVVFSIQQ